MQVAQVSVTFESNNNPPVTWRGSVRGGSFSALCARAARAAKKANPGTQWTSAVVVVLERHREAKS
jgi:hypothetical protein